MRSRRAAVLALSAAFAFALGGPALADEAELKALRSEITTLKLGLAAAEARLERLEAAPSVAPPAPAVAAAPASSPAAESAAPQAVAPPVGREPAAGRDAKAWRQVKTGAAQSEVLNLLGEPVRRFEMAGRTVWYYRYPDAGPGSVFFDAAGRVSSLQRP